MITLYNRTNIDTIPEPKTTDSRYVLTFFKPIIKGNSCDFIENVETEVALLAIDNILLPISINESEYQTSYVSSLYSHYISYALEELYVLNQPRLEKGLAILIKTIGKVLKWSEINKVIYVNNWLLSTNLLIPLSEQQIKEIVQFLTLKFPNHSIVFRSLVEELHSELIDTFLKVGFKKLVSRQVYIAKTWHQLSKKEKTHINADERQIKKHGYEVITISNVSGEVIEDFKRLYNELYIDKYSKQNPLFTNEFYRHCLQEKLMKFFGIYKDGRMVGCAGYWERNGVLTTPILGYEIGLGKHSGLYRILSNVIYKEAEKNHLIDHNSSGAPDFKMNRGAYPSLEYTMVYNNHLSVRRRFSIGLLRVICNGLGVHFFKEKKL